MKVLICIASMGSGGAERQVTYLAKGFVQLGHEVHVALIAYGENSGRLLESGAIIHLVNIYPNSLRFVIPLIRLFRMIGPDVIYLWQRPFDVLGGIAALLSGIPTINAERTNPSKTQPGLKVWLRNIVVPLSKAIITNSDAGVSYWHQRAKFLPVIKIPNIIPFEEMQRVQPSPESKNCIITICRLDVNKNVMTLLRAIKRLNSMDIQFTVIVVGEGAESQNLKRFVRDERISNQVTFSGYRSDAWSLLKGSKCFVSLSFYEGEPNVLLEAAALGCRLIISDIPEHRSLAGLCSMTFVNPDSDLEVADALLSLSLEEPSTATPATAFNHMTPGWTSRSTSSVSLQHLEVFSQALSN